MGLDPAEQLLVADESREYIVSVISLLMLSLLRMLLLVPDLTMYLHALFLLFQTVDQSNFRLGSAATGTPLTMTSMLPVDGTVSLAGANAIDVCFSCAYRNFNHYGGGAIAFSNLNQAGNVRFAATTTITSVDLQV